MKYVHASRWEPNAHIDRKLQLIREWLDLEHQDKKNVPIDFDGWTDYFSNVRFHRASHHTGSHGAFKKETPQQENAWDCGVFTTQFMEGVSRGEDAETFGFGQQDMPYLRKRMIWEIGEKRLAGWKIAAS